MVSKECQIIKDMIKDEDNATLEYTAIIEQMEDKAPEFVDSLYEALDDEDKHADMFRKMGIKFNCDIKEKEE